MTSTDRAHVCYCRVDLTLDLRSKTFCCCSSFSWASLAFSTREMILTTSSAEIGETRISCVMAGKIGQWFDDVAAHHGIRIVLVLGCYLRSVMFLWRSWWNFVEEHRLVQRPPDAIAWTSRYAYRLSFRRYCRCCFYYTLLRATTTSSSTSNTTTTTSWRFSISIDRFCHSLGGAFNCRRNTIEKGLHKIERCWNTRSVETLRSFVAVTRATLKCRNKNESHDTSTVLPGRF